MYLKNSDDILKQIKNITDEVTNDMFDQNGDIYYEVEQEQLSYPYYMIQRLYSIERGIKFIKENHPNIDICLSVTEIATLLAVNIELKLTA